MSLAPAAASASCASAGATAAHAGDPVLASTIVSTARHARRASIGSISSSAGAHPGQSARARAMVSAGSTTAAILVWMWESRLQAWARGATPADYYHYYYHYYLCEHLRGGVGAFVRLQADFLQTGGGEGTRVTSRAGAETGKLGKASAMDANARV